MILSHFSQKRGNVTNPGKGRACLQVILVDVVFKRLDFKRIVAIGNVVTLTVQPSHKIKKCVKDPVEQEKQFHLLPEVNFLVSDQLRLIVRLAGYPDKDEKRETCIVVENFPLGIDSVGQHTIEVTTGRGVSVQRPSLFGV